MKIGNGQLGFELIPLLLLGLVPLESAEAMRTTFYHTIIFHLLLWISAIRAVEGFAPHGTSYRECRALGCIDRLDSLVLLLSASNDAGNNEDEPQTGNEPPQSNVASAVSTQEETPTKPYPIDVPSPILLSASMVLAIASTGEGEIASACSDVFEREVGRELDLDLYL